MATQWTLEDLYHGVLKSWWVLVGAIIAFVLVGVGVFLVYPQTYTAVAQHTVEPISVLSTGSTFNTVNMETERVVATSTTVLERAAEAVGDVSPATIRDATVITVPRGSQVLIFEVTSRSAADSAEWANALATAYGEQRTANARTVVEQTAAELSASIQRLQALYDSQPPDSSERAATQLQLQALLEQQARLTATPFFAGILVTPAAAPSDSNRPGVTVFIAGGLFLGLLIGGIAALIVTRVRSGPSVAYRRRQREQVVDTASAPLLQPDSEVTPGGKFSAASGEDFEPSPSKASVGMSNEASDVMPNEQPELPPDSESTLGPETEREETPDRTFESAPDEEPEWTPSDAQPEYADQAVDELHEPDHNDAWYEDAADDDEEALADDRGTDSSHVAGDDVDAEHPPVVARQGSKRLAIVPQPPFD